jgi:hypothetical protein
MIPLGIDLCPFVHAFLLTEGMLLSQELEEPGLRIRIPGYQDQDQEFFIYNQEFMTS